MNTTLEEAKDLLNIFNGLPRELPQSTLLDICRYPNNRFEEICTRILAFYLNPLGEHRLGDLLLSSLLELITEEDILYQEEDIKVYSEVYAKGKRLDLMIEAPNFIIGIENKIDAPLYNNLTVYWDTIKNYTVDYHFGLVLSLREIHKKDEVDKMKKNNFINKTYNQLFNAIKNNVGNYINGCNQKYLSYLFDFIETIENMDYNNLFNDPLSEFFVENSMKLNNLTTLYNNFNNKVRNLQKPKIKKLRDAISKTTNVKWWIYSGWDLGYNSFDNPKGKIGIESSFNIKNNNPIGEFRIYITTWNLRDWQPYQIRLKELFPSRHIDDSGNRVYMHMDVIDGTNEDLILEKLKEYYDILVELTKD